MIKIIYLIVLLVLLFKNNHIIIKADDCPFPQIPIKTLSGTWYDDPDHASCGFEKLTGPLGPGNRLVVALGSKLFDKGANCGQCYDVTSPFNNKTITVMATDSCHDAGYCQADNHFDFYKEAFDLLGSPSGVISGNSGLSYIKVPCPTYGNVKIMMKDGSNEFWTSFLIFNSRILIKQVSIKLSNSQQFIDLNRQPQGNYWPSTNMVSGEFEVRIESIGGEFIYVKIPSIESRKIYDTGNQFSADGCVGNKYDPYAPFQITSNSNNILPPSLYIIFLISILFLIINNIFSNKY
ncbi:expansin-like protein [Dictyostelium discoideum AX4]|uniref:Expansin-like protein 6 n=1 Tax=Dictyostelium discoideum TaxID=44689 RepID=EXPL6_DICDI|nr:expansin-like protein [Dictyostelium discoideum AX4]Q55G32.1 RecName: Full=Expansin-like protein 6; Short=Ddexpl6; Flags: Precursor [Dictyostelium discoideum]EAL73375.1 expansin-like protein [Dictyostelium discoideum AX4]|eukprot:XP_647351.1 expansin-like protein [Dictyostelium discoideum AX4]